MTSTPNRAAPSYDELAAALERIADAYIAEPAAGDSREVARILRELDDAIADGTNLARTARRRPARPLGQPTGQPPVDDEPARPPAHAHGGPAPPSGVPLT